MKKALAVISFGTTYPEARQAITALETYLAKAMPEYDCYRAFTSKMVIRKIAREEKTQIWTPEELLLDLRAQGYEEVICQSLHVIPGIEYEKMCAQLIEAGAGMQVRIGKPLLQDPEDYLEVCKVLQAEMPILQKDEAFVYMGHGTAHTVNAIYSQVENTFRFLDVERVYVGTVEGFPGLDYIQKRLRKHKIKTVYLAPFMIVAGDHAQNDLAGENPQSWKSILEAEGYCTKVLLKGLGSVVGIGDIFLRHCVESLA